ncbi:MAG: CBS domain-containing protein [Saprospiraceae bacterium]|nr:CBS domain-containing protein [Bacteroidia bacterium]NNF36235.1 CBS domain-containing protein [Saprospiraceae bacterium]
MNLLESVSTIMTNNPVRLSPYDPLVKVKSIFEKMNIHHIPVVDEGKLVGIVSKADFLFFKRGFNNTNVIQKMEEIRLNNYVVKDIMTSGLAKLEPDDKINVALEIFKKNIFHAIPVVKDGRLVGILTTHDIINRLADDKSAVSEYKL